MPFFLSVAGLLVTTAVLPQRVAVVTGASRGIGRGIAVELGRAGYAVYALGRSSRDMPAADVERMASGGQRPVPEGSDLNVDATAEAITAAGGRGVAIPCDVSSDEALERALAEVAEAEGRLDMLVCSAYQTPPGKLRADFWTQGMAMWDAMNGVGLRSVYASCTFATPALIETAKTAPASAPPPLIVLVSSFGGKAYTFNVGYGVGKAAVDRLALDMSVQLKKHGVATTALYPGLVRTEANMQMVEDGTWDEASGGLDLTLGETTTFSGRAVAQLASLGSEAMLARSGSVEVVAELAKEFDFTDVGGSCPSSIRSLQYLLPNFVFPQIEKESGKPVPAWLRDNVPDLLLPWFIFAGPPPEQPED
jgi:dehydrogenase/reductase SDR family protein 1